MTLHGTVKNGVVVLENGRQLPEGTRVGVVVASGAETPTLAGLLKYAGILDDMPSDFAAQHDHYLHGTPKK